MQKKNKKKIKKKRFRIKFRIIILFLSLIGLIITSIVYIINIPISNIIISGNNYLMDQEIIEIAGIQNYPSTLKNSSSKIEKKLEENIYVKSAKVSKTFFTRVYIDIEENRPLFYNQSINRTILLDKKETKDGFNVPILINNIPSAIYDEFIEKMSEIDTNVLIKISEIKYVPDEVDDLRFLFSMNDSNYVYLTLKKIDKINSYNDIVKQFDNKKGILYLNSGGYFDIFE